MRRVTLVNEQKENKTLCFHSGHCEATQRLLRRAEPEDAVVERTRRVVVRAAAPPVVGLQGRASLWPHFQQ